MSTKHEDSVIESPTTPEVDEKGIVDAVESTCSSDELNPIPDGGLWAWMAVLGGSCTTFCTFGFSTSFGVFQDYFVQAGAGTSSDISWIGSLQLFLLFGMGILSGRWFDQGYFRHEFLVGSFLILLSVFMLSICDPSQYYGLVLTQGLLMGVGCGLTTTPALCLQSHYWKKRRALALGLVQAGSSCGGVVMPIMLNRLFNGPAGFAWGTRAVAFLMLVLLVVANCIMKTRLPGTKNKTGGQVPIKTVMVDPPYILTVIATVIFFFGMYFPYFYLQLWVRLHGMSEDLAFYTISILNAGSVFGRIIPNFVADYVGPYNMIIPIFYSCGILLFAMFGVTNVPAVIIFSILYGFATGSANALIPPAMGILARTEDETGLRIGMLFFATSFPILVGTPIDGALLGSDNTYWYKAIIFSGIVMLVGASLLVPARQMTVKRRGTQLT
ncbi:MFS general substrate transporter [Fomitopsis serialis]|uniref:MFS general substrate transporter n=1 Tax=Fomitopsis serialis TaxID=139415 RepID=UPI0020080648|nr:MFS general substrate transporter [Neoantrodia serialis]KAH9914343.1 MFS general substrate transporter [Neoantrodia serialis]